MTAPHPSEKWSRIKWLVTFAFAFGIQGILVFLFSDRELPSAPDETREATVSYLGLTQSNLSKVNQSLIRDASLLTRPHERSFTGQLWNQSVTAKPTYIDWTEAPRFYVRTQYLAGAALKQHIREQAIPSSVVSRSRPELSQAERPHALPIPETTVQFTGEIESRSPKTYASLPSWPHTNLVRPSVISVAIDRFGWAQTSMMISNSLPEADALAMRWIRTTRFQALPPNRKVIDTGLTWGEITFRWATRELTDNSPSPETP